MNCKLGDMAIIVRSFTGREGAIVEVIGEATYLGRHAWRIIYRGSSKHPDHGGMCLALDSQLKPLRGDLKNNEITTTKELEAA